MSSVIHFRPGEAVPIDGIKFAVTLSPSSLELAGYQPVSIWTDKLSLPRVQVGPASRQRAGYLAVAFDAPRATVIVRNVSEDMP